MPPLAETTTLWQFAVAFGGLVVGDLAWLTIVPLALIVRDEGWITSRISLAMRLVSRPRLRLGRPRRHVDHPGGQAPGDGPQRSVPAPG